MGSSSIQFADARHVQDSLVGPSEVRSPRPLGWLPDSVVRGDWQVGRRWSWLSRLPAHAAERAVKPRQTVFRAGEALRGIPVVCEGWAARVSRLSDGRRQILSFVLPGDLVSTNAVFAASLDFYIEAVTMVRYAHFDRAELNERLAADPSLIRMLVEACLAEKEEVDQLATNLGRRCAEERIARLFLSLKERLDLLGLVENDAFAAPLRQQHIADATGLTPVHVNRVIGMMRQHGLIEMAGGVLKIIDLAGLRRVADM